MGSTINCKKDVIINQMDGQMTCYKLEWLKYCNQGGVLDMNDQANISIKQEGTNTVFDR